MVICGEELWAQIATYNPVLKGPSLLERCVFRTVLEGEPVSWWLKTALWDVSLLGQILSRIPSEGTGGNQC